MVKRRAGESRFTAAEQRSSEDPELSDGSQSSSSSTPFTGQGIGTVVNTYTSIYNGDATQIPKGSNGGYTLTNSAVPTVTAAIQTPNTSYCWQDPISNNWTWYNFADIPLWSDYGINKSIYDPCPYGYRVPNNGSWTGFTSTAWAANTLNAGAIWSNTWWPAAGHRNAGSGTLINVGNYGYYWSAPRHPDMYTSYDLGFAYNGGVGPSNRQLRSDGFSVRCVQERAKNLFIRLLS